jgi:uncharacterized membrane protein
MDEQSDRDTEFMDEGDNCTWAFRGYNLDPAHFTTAMVHFYRGELSRSNTWRTRLDATTNWAVVSAGAALTFAFGAPQNPHYMLLLVLVLVLTFLYIEARRYQYYVLWAYRGHLMETDFFAAMLAPPFRPSADWAAHLAESLTQPTFPIARWEAVGRRFRRNYVWLVSLLLLSWGIKLTLHPTQELNWFGVIERAAVGPIPGRYIVASTGVVYGALVLLAVLAPPASVSRTALPGPLQRLKARLRRGMGPRVRVPRRRGRIATIVTRYGQRIALQILKELERGVTALQGTGMYTGEARDVLLCAVTDVQVPHLEEIVCRVDPHAFVVVSAAESVQGWGFHSFEAPS